VNCDHVYARKLDGTRSCVKCTSPQPPIEESAIRELNCGLRTINALHTKDTIFDITICRDETGSTMLEVMQRALDELELRRARE
jgi:hypothetical protein